MPNDTIDEILPYNRHCTIIFYFETGHKSLPYELETNHFYC